VSRRTRPANRGPGSNSMYQMHRVFCATSWELEGERRAFCDVIGEFNERETMRHGVLYVPLSLVNVPDKRRFQYDIEENIRACRHYILTLCDNWGPPERNFERDYRLALDCRADPSQPMREVAFLLRQPPQGQALPADLPSPAGVFSNTGEFKRAVHELLSQWFTTLLSEAGAGARSATA
jgi:hypothetical protein